MENGYFPEAFVWFGLDTRIYVYQRITAKKVLFGDRFLAGSRSAILVGELPSLALLLRRKVLGLLCSTTHATPTFTAKEDNGPLQTSAKERPRPTGFPGQCFSIDKLGL